MATKIFLKDTAVTQAVTGLTGDFVRKMDLSQGSSVVTYKKIVPNGLALTPPTDQARWSKYEGSQPVTWMSEPLTGFTCSGTVTFNMRASESAATCNVTVTAELYRCDINGVIISAIGTATLARAELTTSEAANNWTLTPTSTVLNNGDRLACRVFLDDAGGNTAVGTANLFISGATGATGDSYVQVNETVTAYTNTVQQRTQTGVARIVADGPIPPTGTVTGYLRAQTGVAFIKDGWYNSSWTYRKKLTISNVGRGALSNFPVLVKLSSSRVTYANLKSDGTDLRFITPDGTALDYEIAKWNTSGNSYVWVKIPSLAANTTTAATVYMYYGNAAASDGQNKTGVWSNSYVAVYHFGQAAGNFTDSTSNALNAGTTTVTNRTGDIGLGPCPTFVTTDIVDIGDNAAFDNSSYTIEALYKPTGAGTVANTGTGGHPSDTYPIVTKGRADAETQAADVQFFLGHKSAGFAASDFENIFTGSDPSINSPRTGSTAIVTNSTYHLAQVVSGSSYHKLYVNGVNDINNSGTENIIRNPSTGGTNKVAIGAAFTTAPARNGGIAGNIDEVRISSVARSDDWMAANYASIQDSLVSFQTGETFESTKTQTGVARVTVTTTKTQTGTSRVTAQTLRTQTGKANIAGGASTDRTQTGVANIKASVTRDQTGKAAVKVSTTRTQSGISKISVSTTRTQTGIANVKASVLRTQTGVGNVKNTTTRDQTGKANIYVAGAWYNAAWQKRKKLTIDNSAQAQTLTDFPVLVKLNSSRFTFADAQTAGQDLRFTSADGTTLLNFEISSYDNSGQTAIIWVKVPSVAASTTTDIYMYYANGAASDGQNKNGTWNSGYAAVYHFAETTSTYSDSTSNNNTTDTPTLASRTADIGLGNCPQMTGSTHFITVPDSATFDSSSYTIEALVQSAGAGATPTSGTGGSGIATIYPIVTKGYAEAETQAADIHFFLGQIGTTNVLGSDFENIATGGTPSGNNPLTTGSAIGVNGSTINHVAQVISGSSYHRNFIDGAQNATASISLNPSSGGTQKVGIGVGVNTAGTTSGWFNGKIDEVRISNVARSNEWIAASSKSAKDASFVSFGSVETGSTTRTQTGVARITVQTSRTQTGVSRVTATTTRTQTGVAHVSTATVKDQTGKANIKAPVSRTQTGVSNLVAQRTAEVSWALFEVPFAAQTTQNQTGKARITATTTRTQTGKSAVKKTVTRDQTGKGSIKKVTRLYPSDDDGYFHHEPYPFYSDYNISVPNGPLSPDDHIWGYMAITGTQFKNMALVNSDFLFKYWAYVDDPDCQASLVFKLTVNRVGVDTPILLYSSPETLTTTPTGYFISADGISDFLEDDNEFRLYVALTDAPGVTAQNGSGDVHFVFGGTPGGTGDTYMELDGVHTETIERWQNGVANVKASVVQTQTGKAAVKVSTTSTQTGKAAVKVTTTRTQTGVADVKKTIARDQTGVSRINLQSTRTQTGVADIKKTVTRDQTGKGSVAVTATRTQTGKANVKASILRTQAGKANLLVNGVGVRDQYGVANIKATLSRTQTGVSRITVQPLRTQLGKADIKGTTLRPQTGVADIKNTTSRTQTGAARVKVSVLRAQSGVSRILVQPLRTQTGVANVFASTVRNQTGVSRITVQPLRTQTGKASVKAPVSRTQLGVARVSLTTLRTQLGVAKILVPGTGIQNQLGKAAIKKTTTQVQTGKGRVGLVTTRTQTGVAKVIPNTQTVTKTGTSLIYRTEQVTKTGTSFIKRVNTITKAGTSQIIRLVYTITKTGKSWIVGGNARQFLTGYSEIVSRPTITKTGRAQIHKGTGVEMQKTGTSLITKRIRVKLPGTSVISRLRTRIIKGKVKIGKYQVPIVKLKTLKGRSVVT